MWDIFRKNFNKIFEKFRKILQTFKKNSRVKHPEEIQSLKKTSNRPDTILGTIIQKDIRKVLRILVENFKKILVNFE